MDCTNDANKQRAQVLALLKAYTALTTDQFRAHGVMHPSGRIMELRREGHQIITERSRVTGLDGRLHTQARYVLLGRGAK
ncbi:hypothetical protein M622_17680 [Thauera terpenica 58Eu]|uniref:Winged helix-turn-helix domain-containing protein n=1 Tax=Thauera terpenica 58Eu TaxID=1348657 RepID=S9ZC73_9RHOO|nr:hypothetical protein M622_17680 [Thauera terpenica 58Eu]